MLKILLLFSFLLNCAPAEHSKYISREQAIRIARRHGCYHSHSLHGFESGATLDTVNNVWRVSKEKNGYRRAGNCQLTKSKVKTKGEKTVRKNEKDRNQCDCAHTNGCTTSRWKEITIDAFTGKVLKIDKGKMVFPNYE